MILRILLMNHFKFVIISIICIAGAYNMKLADQSLKTHNIQSFLELNQAASNNTLETRNNTKWGDYLTDNRGMALYYFSKDHNGTGFLSTDFESSCYGRCAADWPPLISNHEHPSYVAGRGVTQALIGTIKRKNSSYQLTYHNIPLYYYRLDTKPGDVKGQLLHKNGGIWYLISPQGRPIMNARD